MPGFPVHHQLPEFTQLMSIDSDMPSIHIIVCHPLLLPPSIFPIIRVFSNESVPHIRWSKYWSFNFSISPFNEYSGMNSFYIKRVIIYNLDVLLSQFGTSLLFHVQLNCCFLTCIQISQEAGQVVWYSHLFQNFPQFVVIHTVKSFGVVKKAEINVFLEISCFFNDPVDVGNLISGSSAFSKTSLNIWKFTVHILLKPGWENFDHYFPSM